jgi:hypothetical protein
VYTTSCSSTGEGIWCGFALAAALVARSFIVVNCSAL